MTYTGWIIYNGSLAGNKFIDFAQWLQRAATKLNCHTNIIKNNQLFATFTTNELSILQSEHTALPDFVISTDKDLYLARQFELLGIPVFNSTKSIEISDDKILTHQYLAKNKIPTPKTIVAPKVYKDVNAVGAKDMKHIVNALAYPFIIKEAFGSFGE
ncbi:MAG TPA: RimK family alpha-L-glutamate ligase, partial [Candidatus Avamphibacillus intestinigallinarum]|nr:RimK family alpha-L-glutamate ligase [Candidatus Avamphibacillus intestinigallinarum]